MSVRDTTQPLTVTLADEAYLRRLHVLGAWWSLGSSALEPRLLLQDARAPVVGLYEAGL
jgi:hypothetical protein